MTAVKPSITPAMRVGELLDTWPELEPLLVALAPPFRKLRNPVLRRTVARVTTLQKAAAVADIPVGQLVNQLRQAVGQSPEIPVSSELEALPASMELPEWARSGQVVQSIDADELLERGEHPLSYMQSLLASAGSGEIVRLQATFRPEPLLDMFQRKGYRVHAAKADPGWHILIQKQ